MAIVADVNNQLLYSVLCHSTTRFQCVTVHGVDATKSKFKKTQILYTP